MTHSPIDEKTVIDLYELKYMFAVETIDPRRGRIEVKQVIWDYSMRGEAEKTYEEIQMVDCKELLPEPGYWRVNPRVGHINNEVFNPYRGNFRHATEFMCPNTTSLILQGQYTTLDFKYIEIKINGCDQDLLTEDEGECADVSENENMNINIIGIQSHVDFSKVNIEDVVKYQKTL